MHTIFSKAFYVPRNPTRVSKATSLSAEGPENGQPGLSSEVFKTRYHTIYLHLEEVILSGVNPIESVNCVREGFLASNASAALVFSPIAT